MPAPKTCPPSARHAKPKTCTSCQKALAVALFVNPDLKRIHHTCVACYGVSWVNTRLEYQKLGPEELIRSTIAWVNGYAKCVQEILGGPDDLAKSKLMNCLLRYCDSINKGSVFALLRIDVSDPAASASADLDALLESQSDTQDDMTTTTRPSRAPAAQVHNPRLRPLSHLLPPLSAISSVTTPTTSPPPPDLGAPLKTLARKRAYDCLKGDEPAAKRPATGSTGYTSTLPQLTPYTCHILTHDDKKRHGVVFDEHMNNGFDLTRVEPRFGSTPKKPNTGETRTSTLATAGPSYNKSPDVPPASAPLGNTIDPQNATETFSPSKALHQAILTKQKADSLRRSTQPLLHNRDTSAEHHPLTRAQNLVEALDKFCSAFHARLDLWSSTDLPGSDGTLERGQQLMAREMHNLDLLDGFDIEKILLATDKFEELNEVDGEKICAVGTFESIEKHGNEENPGEAGERSANSEENAGGDGSEDDEETVIRHGPFV